jgi:hypothetical protein
MPYDDLIEKHANRVGVSSSWMKKIMRIESGGNASNVTGSYKGLFQLSDKEFKSHGGSGNILDPEQNIMAASNKLARDKLAFKERHGKDPSLTDLYMVHQQGEGGYAAHVANPDRPAWQNMLSTGEGKQKGEAWAKKAIWGNIPDQAKKQFGSVENVSSKDFVGLWGDKVEGTTYASYGPMKVAKKGTPAEVEEGVGTARGSFLGEEPEEKKEPSDFPIQPTPSIPEVRVPTVIGGLPMPAARAPRIPGATRWESG